MPNYRRLRAPGATYYFEVCLENPASTLLIDRLGALSDAWRATAAELPFTTETLVVLPNKIHTIWTLPAGDADFSERWRLIKYRFSRAVPDRCHPSASKRRKRERGLWQRRFWEHRLRDEIDLARHTRLCEESLEGLGTAWPFAFFEPFDGQGGLPFRQELAA